MKFRRVAASIILAATCWACSRQSATTPANAATKGYAPLELSATIPLDGVEGRIDHMAVDEKSGRLFIAALGNNTVEVIDLATAKRVDTLKGFDEPQGIAAVSDLQQMAIASGSDKKCRIFDADLKSVGQINDLDDADNARYDPHHHHIIVGYGSGALAIIDPKTAAKIADIQLDAHPESFQIESAGTRIFVNVPGAAHVAVVDSEKHTVIARWPIQDAQANFAMALDEQNHRLFIGCRHPAKLIVLNTDSGKPVAALDIAGDTDDIFYDSASKQIYVTGGGGQINVIAQQNPNTYTAIASIETAPGARTSCFVPSRGTLYVAVPHRGSQKARLLAFKKTTAPQP